MRDPAGRTVRKVTTVGSEIGIAMMFLAGPSRWRGGRVPGILKVGFAGVFFEDLAATYSPTP